MECWLLLRGLAREKQHWGSFPKRLSTALGNCPVHCVDLLGNGEFHNDLSPLSISEYLDHCRNEFFKLLDPSISPTVVKIHILAFSFAGAVGIEWGRRYPDEVTSLILLNSSLPKLSSVRQRINLKFLVTNFIRLFASLMPIREEAILSIVVNSASKRQQELRRWIDIQKQHPIRRVNVYRQLFAAARYRPPIRFPQIKGLVLSSKGDRLVSYKCSEAIAKAGSWPLALHPNAGHDIAIDDPQWIIDQILENMKR